METKMQRFPMSKIKSEWGTTFKAGIEAYNVFVFDDKGNCSHVKQTSDQTQFIYRPPVTGEPLINNVTMGYRFNEWHRIRCGKRYIKIKRFGKTRRYYVSKFMMTRGRILNDKWIHNLRTPL